MCDLMWLAWKQAATALHHQLCFVSWIAAGGRISDPFRRSAGDVSAVCSAAKILALAESALGASAGRPGPYAKLVKDMEQVTFSHPDTLAWLTSTVAQITQSLSKACEKEFATAWDAASQLESLLAKLPDPAAKKRNTGQRVPR